MLINPEITNILREFKIDPDQGTLFLLGVYFNLNIENFAPESIVKAINLTKIVEKDYEKKTVKWNIALFDGQQTDWDWVKTWNDRWRIQPDRKASNPDVLKRMQEWFKKYPKYRVEDVQRATDMYFRSTTIGYLKNSAAFIFDGAGAMKKSILLSWCEKLTVSTSTEQKGRVVK